MAEKYPLHPGEKSPPRKVRKLADGASEEDDDEISLTGEKDPPSEMRTTLDKVLEEDEESTSDSEDDEESASDSEDVYSWEPGVEGRAARGHLHTYYDIAHGYIRLSEEYVLYHDLKVSKHSRVYQGKQQSEFAGLRHVIIKLINDNERSRREVRHLREIDFHPNIVPILHSGIYTPDIGSYIYIVMEECRENLKYYMERLKRQNIPLEEDQKLAVAKQFLRGLKFIHQNGIINGNIKLENVLISNDGNYIKICSFGLKRSLHQDSSTANQSRKPEDTSGSGAPETYAKNVLSKEEDVFSAGLLVYSIVSDGNDPDRWISNIRDNTNRDLSNISITDEKGMEKLLNHMLEDAPEDRPSVEMTLENDIFQKATTDLYLPEDVSRLAKSQPYEKEENRLEDEFQKKIIPAFPKIEAFKKFARSKKGLCLDEEDIQLIAEDHADSENRQKMCILRKWQEKIGSEATVQKIRSILLEYQKPKPVETTQSTSGRQLHNPESEQLEQLKCVFEEVTKPYTSMEELKGFAKSKSGLGLTENEFYDITSFVGQKLRMLELWRKRRGSDATVKSLRSCAESYAAEKF